MPHHHHTHSKASSTSSVSIASPSVTSHHKAKSPHNSVKVLPATPTSTTFPSNIRLVRAGAPSIGILPVNEGGAAFGIAPPASPGIMFAKRKRSPFKGPGIATQGPGGAGTNPWRSRSGGEAGGSRGASVQGRRSGEGIMGITEEEEEEEEIEEVDDFSPGLKPGEFVVTVNDDAERAPPTPPKG